MNRKDKNGNPWEPTDNSKICSQHFEGGRKSLSRGNPGYFPTFFPLTNPNPEEYQLYLESRRKQRREARTIAQIAYPLNITKEVPLLPVVKEDLTSSGDQEQNSVSEFASMIEAAIGTTEESVKQEEVDTI